MSIPFWCYSPECPHHPASIVDGGSIVIRQWSDLGGALLARPFGLASLFTGIKHCMVLSRLKLILNN
jgi:hypothetical protein